MLGPRSKRHKHFARNRIVSRGTTAGNYFLFFALDSVGTQPGDYRGGIYAFPRTGGSINFNDRRAVYVPSVSGGIFLTGGLAYKNAPGNKYLYYSANHDIVRRRPNGISDGINIPEGSVPTSGDNTAFTKSGFAVSNDGYVFWGMSWDFTPRFALKKLDVAANTTSHIQESASVVTTLKLAVDDENDVLYSIGAGSQSDNFWFDVIKSDFDWENRAAVDTHNDIYVGIAVDSEDDLVYTAQGNEVYSHPLALQDETLITSISTSDITGITDITIDTEGHDLYALCVLDNGSGAGDERYTMKVYRLDLDNTGAGFSLMYTFPEFAATRGGAAFGFVDQEYIPQVQG